MPKRSARRELPRANSDGDLQPPLDLSRIIDCFDGLSRPIGIRPDAELVNSILEVTIEQIGNAKSIRSVLRKGCSFLTAACEGFFRWLKTDPFYPKQWRSTTIE